MWDKEKNIYICIYMYDKLTPLSKNIWDKINKRNDQLPLQCRKNMWDTINKPMIKNEIKKYSKSCLLYTSRCV